MRKTNTLKAIVLSLGLAALMAPATLDAQINHGLLQNPYKTESNKNHGMLNSQPRSGETFDISNQGIGQPDSAPLGSGIAIMLVAGLGYVALKKKED